MYSYEGKLYTPQENLCFICYVFIFFFVDPVSSAFAVGDPECGSSLSLESGVHQRHQAVPLRSAL